MIAKLAGCISVSLFIGLLAIVGFAADEQDDDEQKKYPFRVKFVDEDGKPVKEVTAGVLAVFGPGNETITPTDDSGWHYLFGATSDEEGVAAFPDGGDRHHLCVVGRNTKRKLVGVWKLDAQKLNPENAADIVKIVMHPECRVTGRLTCGDLTKNNRDLGAAYVRLHAGGNIAFEMYTDDTDKSSFHFFVPPGEYELKPYGTNLHEVEKHFSVKAGQHELDIGAIELPATRLALLTGLPAPKLDGIDCWKNGPAVDLANLKGKCVILEFWGYWCGPCVHRMPQLFKIYDKYHAQGLEVVGIHVDLGEDEEEPVNTVAKLDNRLAAIRKELWSDRDLPFPVAIIAGKRAPYDTSIETRKAPCQLVADYGITGYPTMVLIDPKGNVVGRFAPHNPKHIALLEELLKRQ